MAVRKTLLAGSWYPRNPDELFTQFSRVPLPPDLQKIPRGLVLPHAGLSYSARGQSQALSWLSPVIRSVLIVSPSHYEHLDPHTFIWANYDSWETPLGNLPGLSLSFDSSNPGWTNRPSTLDREHGIELLLPGLAWKTRDWDHKPRIAAIVVPSTKDPNRIYHLYDLLETQLLPQLPEPRVIVISSDFCHYGPRFAYTPWGSFSNQETRIRVKKLDVHIATLAAKGEMAELLEELQKPTMPTICGIIPLFLLSLLGVSRGWSGKILDYYNSDEQGVDGNAVAYCPMVYHG